jgi:hypothetical protein
MTSSLPSWDELARAAATKTAHAKHGSREAALDKALTELKRRWPDLTLAKQTLRTAMLASAFVDEIGEGDAQHARTLQRLPAIAVETLYRWHRYDADEAKRQAELYAAGGHSVRRLIEAERKARRASRDGGRTGRSGRSLFEENLGASVTGFLVFGSGMRVEDWTGREPTESERRVVPPAVLDKVALGTLTLTTKEPRRRSADSHVDCAALVAGPYAEPEIATSRVSDWMLRALGLTFYFPRVALLLANRPASTGIMHLVPAAAWDTVLVVAPDASKS